MAPSKFQSDLDFSVGTCTVRVQTGTTKIVQLYATSKRVDFMYRLAYAPETLIDLYEGEVKEAAKVVVGRERIALANMNMRRAAEKAEAVHPGKEADYVMSLCTAHRARQAQIGSALTLSPPENDTVMVDLHAKMTAESYMAAYIYAYYTMMYVDGLILDWPLFEYVNPAKIGGTPSLPPVRLPIAREGE